MMKMINKRVDDCCLLKLTYDYNNDILEIEDEVVTFLEGERTKYLPCQITPDPECDLYDPEELSEIERKLTFFYYPESKSDSIQESKNYWYGLGLSEIDIHDVNEIPFEDLTLILRR